MVKNGCRWVTTRQARACHPGTAASASRSRSVGPKMPRVNLILSALRQFRCTRTSLDNFLVCPRSAAKTHIRSALVPRFWSLAGKASTSTTASDLFLGRTMVGRWSGGSAIPYLRPHIFCNGFGARLHMQLFVDATNVGADGINADVQFARKLFVSPALGQAIQHSLLAR